MPFPPPPTDKISDWSNVDLATTYEVNGHVEILYRGGSGWGRPRFVRDPYLRIHGLSPSINYGQQAYEGMKAYRNIQGQIHIFRPHDHAARLARSAAFVSIPPLPSDVFVHSVHLAVSHNAEFVPPHTSGAAMYIRPILIGLSAQLAPIPPSDFLFAVYVQPLSPYLGRTALDAIVLDDFDRAAPCGVGAAKIGGNYAPVMRWSAATKAEGFGLTLHLDSKTHTEIEEFSTSGFLGIVERDSQVSLVVSDSTNVIKSITTDSVAQIAASFGWNVEKRAIMYSELADLSEVIAAGSASALVSVSSITRKLTGDKFVYESAGPHYTRLANRYHDIVHGIAEDEYVWCERVVEMEVEEGVSSVL